MKEKGKRKMKKRILLLLCSVLLVLGLAACGSKENEKTDKDANQKVEQSESKTDRKEEKIVFTKENADKIVEEHQITVIGTFVSSVEVTAEDNYNTVEENEDGTEKYMVYTWDYTLEDGTKLEVVENYSNPDKPDAFYSLALKDEKGNIYGEVSNGGVDTETKGTTIYVLEKELYEDYMEFEIGQLRAEMEAEMNVEGNGEASESFE